MDPWLFWDVAHRDHPISNPIGERRLAGLVGLLGLTPGARLLDVGCGKGELLCRAVARCRGRGVGIDLSPTRIRQAGATALRHGVADRVDLLEMDGQRYEAAEGNFDATACVGASWIWKGHLATLRALGHWTRPGGVVLTGEPYWRREPSAEYLVADGDWAADTFTTHPGNVRLGREAGLVPLYAAVSDAEEWERYEGMQLAAAVRYAGERAFDPLAQAIAERARQMYRTYERWGRDTLGFGLYLFRRPRL